MEIIKLKKEEYEFIIKNTKEELSKEDSRPILKYINIKINNNILTACSLDGYMLSKVVLKLQYENENTDLMIEPIAPAKNAVNIDIIQDNQITTIKQYLDNGTETINQYRAVYGDFINYNQIIASKETLQNDYISIKLDSQRLAQILKSFKDKNNNNAVRIYLPKEKNKAIYLENTENENDIVKLLLPLREF